MSENHQGDIIIYQNDNGNTKIDVRFVDETVWLTQAQLVELFQSSKANISEHIKNIYEEGELDESSTVRYFRTVRQEGSRTVERELFHYNLDMIKRKASERPNEKNPPDICKQRLSFQMRPTI